MFAARFDPTAFAAPVVEEISDNEKKRKLESSDDESSDESESEEEEEEEEKLSENSEEDEKFSSDEDMTSDSAESVTSDMEEETNDKMDVDDEQVISEKHLSVLKRFKKSISKLQLEKEDEEDEEQIEEGELNDIAPLPQPALPKDKKLSSLSTLNSNLDWLTKPIYYQTDLVKPFDELEPKISSVITNNLLKHFDIKTAFSVQISVIETMMQDIEKNKLSPKFQGDLLVNASTGSGKTLAYSIPLVQTLMDRVVPRLRCVILVPTKPLIQQVRSTLFNLSKGIDLNIMTFKNDSSIKEELERYLATRPDIIISTPGRLVEHLPNLDLTYLRYLIIDEADRLLNQSFQNWCDLLISKLSSQQVFNKDKWGLKCSKLIFSATLTTNSERLSHLKLDKPRLIIINNQNELVNELYQLPPRIKECYIRFNEGLSYHKPLILFKFLIGYENKDDGNQDFKFNKNILIFTKSNESSLRLTRLLNLIARKYNANMKIVSINSSLKNQERQKILKQFENNEIDVLISTDLISRGINLPNIKTVLNYDLPLSSKEYIHRIGRTARANKFGYAISFMFGKGEWKFMSGGCFFNPSISRNNKEVHKIKVTRKQREMEQDQEPGFELEIEEFEKKIYEDCLEELKNEVLQS